MARRIFALIGAVAVLILFLVLFVIPVDAFPLIFEG